MIRDFEYHRPGDLAEAGRLLGALPHAHILAGGTDLLVDAESGIRDVRHVVSLRGITGLDGIEEREGLVSIGSACTAASIQASTVLRNCFPELVELVGVFACPQVRTVATAGGNICSAVPCGDFPALLMALDASVELVSPKGSRRVALRDFFTGPRETVRDPVEILTRIMVPLKAPTAAACYMKYQRRASNSLAVTGVAALLDLRDSRCHTARIVLGAVAPVHLPADRAALHLKGKEPTRETIEEAAELAAAAARPITDIRGGDDYRRQLVRVLCRRVLLRIVEQLRKEAR